MDASILSCVWASSISEPSMLTPDRSAAVKALRSLNARLDPRADAIARSMPSPDSYASMIAMILGSTMRWSGRIERSAWACWPLSSRVIRPASPTQMHALHHHHHESERQHPSTQWRGQHHMRMPQRDRHPRACMLRSSEHCTCCSTGTPSLEVCVHRREATSYPFRTELGPSAGFAAGVNRHPSPFIP